jgi:hypothetical protein
MSQFSSTRTIGDIPDSIAIGTRRVPFTPLGVPHWLTATGSVRAWEGWSVNRGPFASDAANGLLASAVLPQGCNISLAFAVGDAATPAGKTANVRLWVAKPIVTDTGDVEYVAQPWADLIVTGGALTIPASSRVIPPGLAGVEAFCDTIGVTNVYTMTGNLMVFGNAAGGIAEAAGESSGGVQVLASVQVNGGTATASGAGIFVRTL